MVYGKDAMTTQARIANHERKMGRPVKKEHEKIKFVLGVTFRSEEAKEIKEKAQEQGLPVATFLRRLVLFSLKLLKNNQEEKNGK